MNTTTHTQLFCAQIEEIDETADDVPDLEEIEDFPDLKVADDSAAAGAASPATTVAAPIQNRDGRSEEFSEPVVSVLPMADVQR